MEQFSLRHAKQFIDSLEQKITQENKFNILALNFNVVKTACLVIELLHITAQKFD